MDSSDTAYMLLATSLVMFMPAGLALFYGGLLGSKNVLATMMQSFLYLGVVSILWVVCGYSVAFGPDHWGAWAVQTGLSCDRWDWIPAPMPPPFPACSFRPFSSCLPSSRRGSSPKPLPSA
uniref:hypothetical protein n=1 Tax=Desulfosoma caldarium TaxID=610254 RepID=UPI0026D59426